MACVPMCTVTVTVWYADTAPAVLAPSLEISHLAFRPGDQVVSRVLQLYSNGVSRLCMCLCLEWLPVYA